MAKHAERPPPPQAARRGFAATSICDHEMLMFSIVATHRTAPHQ
jgi:hypothetical protein